MTNQRVARGQHVAEASRILPLKRGEKLCPVNHDTAAVRNGARCPTCGATK